MVRYSILCFEIIQKLFLIEKSVLLYYFQVYNILKLYQKIKPFIQIINKIVIIY